MSPFLTSLLGSMAGTGIILGGAILATEIAHRLNQRAKEQVQQTTAARRDPDA